MALPPQPMGSLVDSGLVPGDTAGLPDVEVSVNEPMGFEDGAEITDDGQGGAIIEAIKNGEIEIPADAMPFDANLAEILSDSILDELSAELRSLYEEDLESRSEWEETYVNGLDLLGLKTTERSSPFEGASGITHPLISESVTQFQSQAYKEMLPPGGPVRTRLMGIQDAAHEEQAKEHTSELQSRLHLVCRLLLEKKKQM